MGQESSHSTEVSSYDYSKRTCRMCREPNDFRALQCGHCFCIQCLAVLRELHGTTIYCPLDRCADETELENLPLPENFKGKLLMPTFSENDSNDFENLLGQLIKTRGRTIEHLRSVATALSSMELQCEGAKIGGSVAGIIGGGMAMAGIGLSLSGIGVIFGAPLAVSGAVIGGAGGLTTGITVVVENILRKNGIDEIEHHLEEDYFQSEQMKVLLSRASQDIDFARKWSINPQDAIGFVALIPRALKVGLATAAGARAAIALSTGAARAAASSGLHVGGLLFSAALIPIDFAQMIVSSIKIHHKQPSEIVQTIFTRADNLDIELQLFLMTGNYPRLFHCSDKDGNRRWVYVIISAINNDAVMNNLQSHELFTYEEVKKLGEVLEEGNGDNVPQHIVDSIHQTWYSLHNDHADG